MKKIIALVSVVAGVAACAQADVSSPDSFYAQLHYGNTPLAPSGTTYAGPVLTTGSTPVTLNFGSQIQDLITVGDRFISITNASTDAPSPTRHYGVAGFNGLQFTLNSGYQIASASLNTDLTTYVGLNSSAVTFDATHVFVNFAYLGTQLDTQSGSVISLDITTVPEPTTLALAGLGALAVVLRKRK